MEAIVFESKDRRENEDGRHGSIDDATGAARFYRMRKNTEVPKGRLSGLRTLALGTFET
jgi:hypothetical protein